LAEEKLWAPLSPPSVGLSSLVALFHLRNALRFVLRYRPGICGILRLSRPQPEDGGCRFLRSVFKWLPHCTASSHRTVISIHTALKTSQKASVVFNSPMRHYIPQLSEWI
jgi:hypothetical protein